MSDLNSEEGSTDVIVEQDSSTYDKKINSLQAEVEHLKTEVTQPSYTTILNVIPQYYSLKFRG